tara:strand:- start:382632 stop:383744 length:1113 start_codon:yes stop_codon:yes gene_type:complete
MKPNSSTQILNTPPNSSIGEISLFGPGIGECVVLHTGDNNWVIVDSCLDPLTKKPVALEYLKSLGLDPNEVVTSLFISHWHSDHIAGAYEILKTCQSANIYISEALKSNEMLHLKNIFKDDPFTGLDKEIKEFKQIINFLKETNRPDRLHVVSSGKLILDKNLSFRVKIVSLSPSDAAVVQAITTIGNKIPKPKTKRRSNAIPQSPNLNAIALHLSFGNISLLLGSDLENSSNIHTGWEAIFTQKLYQNLSLDKSIIFKVSHHGSSTSHNEKVWTDLLDADPISITTTYTRSSLPTPSDISRISSRSSKFFITRDPQKKKKLSRESMIEKELKVIGIEKYAINDAIGHIQIRFSDSSIISHGKNQTVLEI